MGDLLKWNASLDGATGEWAEVVRRLQAPSKLRDGRVLDYALGLTIDDQAGVRRISHGGATSGYRTFLSRFPAREGKLVISSWPAPALTAEPTFADGFKFAGGWHATFTRDARGRIIGCELTNGRCRRVRFERR